MSIRDLFGSGSKARPVGTTLESGREGGRFDQERHLAFKTSIFVMLVVVTLLVFPRSDSERFVRPVGSVWTDDDLRAPIDFPILKTEAELRAERDSVRFRVPPVFAVVPDAVERVVANRDTVAAQLGVLFEAYASYLQNRARGRIEAALADSVQVSAIRRNMWVKASASQWDLLFDSFERTVPGLPTVSRSRSSGQRLDVQLLQYTFELALNLQENGVLDVSKDSIRTEVIRIRNRADRTEQRQVPIASLIGIDQVDAIVRERMEARYSDPEIVNLGRAFFRQIFEATLLYQRKETYDEIARRTARTSPHAGLIARGDLIVERGEQITPATDRYLLSLEAAVSQDRSSSHFWLDLLGQLMFVLSAYLIFFLYIFLVRRKIFENNRHLLLVTLIFLSIVLLFGVALRMPQVPMYAVPVCVAAVLLTVFFDSRVGLFGTLTLALLGGVMRDFDFIFMYATLFAGVLGVFSVRDIKNRSQYFSSVLYVLAGYAVVLTAVWLSTNLARDRYLFDLTMCVVSSVQLVAAFPLLWLIERPFGITTDLTLVELNNTNHPLLKELSLRAPGTMTHANQVATLAEAAAEAVGANHLLARVGALYHDVGKMLKPEYFTENQGRENPHDQLKPRLSALIIVAHVKDGINLGREYNLPERIVSFIRSHHGTTLIAPFFYKAREQQGPKDPAILESEFRYPGPKPTTREEGIVMLADSTQAATASLTHPTPKKVDELIKNIFDAKLRDGQLEDTPLTFSDLSRIRDTFSQVLAAHFHSRVKYPGQDKEEDETSDAETSAEGESEEAIWDTLTEKADAEAADSLSDNEPNVSEKRAAPPSKLPPELGLPADVIPGEGRSYDPDRDEASRAGETEPPDEETLKDAARG